MNPSTHFATLARYNAWATRRLLDAVAQLPEADYRRDVGLFFRSIHGTLNHLLVGEQLLWFPRFAEGVSPRLALDDEAEPDRARLAQRLSATLEDPDGGVEGVKAQSAEITAFLRKWLVDHVMKTDMKLVPLFRKTALR